MLRYCSSIIRLNKLQTQSEMSWASCTGAGDLFASGFLYGMLRQYSLQKCCRMGCLAGGAIVQTLGAEMTQANWKWLFDRYQTLL